MGRLTVSTVVMLVITAPALVQEPPKKPASGPATSKATGATTEPPSKEVGARPNGVVPLLQGEPILVSNLPPEANDEGFNRFARFADLPDVINSRKPGDLADFALLTAEAEKVLGRSHKSGVTARQILHLALEMSRQESDDKSVSRIQQRVKAAYPDLKLDGESAVPSTLQFVEETKKAAKQLPADTPPKARETFEAILGDVKTATLLQNTDRLTELEGIVGSLSDLTPEAKGHLASVIKSAGKQKPKESAEAKALSGLLSRLLVYAGAIFYEHSWAGGATYTIYGDQFERSNMPDNWNDVVSSLWVRRGHLVYCYQHSNYGGARCWVLVESDGTPASSPFRESRVNGVGLVFEMSGHGWNDVVSSFRLQLR